MRKTKQGERVLQSTLSSTLCNTQVVLTSLWTFYSIHTLHNTVPMQSRVEDAYPLHLRSQSVLYLSRAYTGILFFFRRAPISTPRCVINLILCAYGMRVYIRRRCEYHCRFAPTTESTRGVYVVTYLYLPWKKAWESYSALFHTPVEPQQFLTCKIEIIGVFKAGLYARHFVILQIIGCSCLTQQCFSSIYSITPSGIFYQYFTLYASPKPMYLIFQIDKKKVVSNDTYCKYVQYLHVLYICSKYSTAGRFHSVGNYFIICGAYAPSLSVTIMLTYLFLQFNLCIYVCYLLIHL